MAKLDSVPLEERRQTIAENFAKKILKHPAYRKIFAFNEKSNMRSGKKVIVPTTKTARYEKSTIPSLCNIINQKLSHKI